VAILLADFFNSPVAVLHADYQRPMTILSNRAYKDYDDLFEATKKAWNKISTQKFCSVCNAEWISHEN